MSALARELRAIAEELLAIGADIPASFAHTHALMLEAAEGDAALLSPSINRRKEPILIDMEDCIAVYGEDLVDEVILADLDEHNDCTDPGGHVWLAENGEVMCLRCGVLGMPIKSSREVA